ncbi:hypothetical protein F4820DRAFT_454359 [Hypoxylon rubiginosum]|uniref:Uncharacterized protein n=1 Tax=Hypoxylon rubiginosum TaxID=110542 RepID=A0ACB9YIJ5_9PEZI|nr:hypothetical protein F4820DRAFT_454359 [Hypoxylon rubiginosum]
MTTKILNKSWFDTLRDQYQQDIETNITFPLTYIFYYKPWDRDLQYEIKHKISVTEFETSLITFRRRDTSSEDDPSYEDQNAPGTLERLGIRSKGQLCTTKENRTGKMKVSNLFVLAVALPAASCWELFVSNTNGGVAGFATGARDTKGCRKVSSSDARNYNAALVTDMGRCIVYYFASKDDCLDGLHPTMSLGDHERGTWYSWRYSRNRYYQVDC